MHFVITRRAPLDTPDGINISIFSLGDALRRAGHDVTFVSGTMSNADELRTLYGLEATPAVVALSDRRGWDPSYRRLLTPWVLHGRQAIARLRPDYVIVNGAVPVPLSVPSCVVSHDLEDRLPRRWRLLYKRVTYRLATHIVATCSEIRDLLSREIGKSRRSITVIPTCFDLRGYGSRPLPDRERAILHMGTVPYKNPSATLRAFARLRTDARLYLTGKVDEQLRAELDGLPQVVRSRIELLGYVEAYELRDLLARVRVVSVPSKYSVPVASPSVIEAFASATPVIAGPSISRDVLHHDRDGFLVPDDQPDATAERIEQLLTDDATWQRLSAGARERSGDFSADTVAERYVTLARRGSDESGQVASAASAGPSGRS